jgi:hypothetical protein
MKSTRPLYESAFAIKAFLIPSAILAFATSSALYAQMPPRQPGGGQQGQGQGGGPGGPQGGPGGPQGGMHRPPPCPIVVALDANHDHVISAEEMQNAPQALKSLDRNGDGQLTPDEFAPPPPHRGSGGPGRQQGGGSENQSSGPGQQQPGQQPDSPQNDQQQGGSTSSRQGGQGGQQQGGHRPPPCPVVEALDANRDRVISADEIQNAAQALKALDRNGDGKLTPDEFAPRPPQGGGPNGRQNGGNTSNSSNGQTDGPDGGGAGQ